MAAVSLLEQGLGYVHDYSAAQSPDSAQLYEAEARAKAANIGVWKDYDPVAEAEAKAREELASSTESLPVEEETKSVMVSEISRNGAIYLQVMGDEAKKLEKMMAAFSLSHKQAPLGDFKPKAGELCSAQFTLDNEWYRAQVLSATKSGSFEVLYIDYGNSEEVPPSRVRKLESQFSTASLRPQAQECKLAFVELPSLADEYGVEALQALKASTEGKVLSAKFISRGKVPQVVLATEKGVNLNEALLRKGYGFIDRLTQKKFQQSHQAKLKAGLARSLVGSQSGPKDPLEVMMEAQDEAKKAHLNIWRYGDFRADDEF